MFPALGGLTFFFFVVLSQKCVNICHHLPVMSPGQVRFCISAAHTIPQLREVSAVFFFRAVSIVFQCGKCLRSFTRKQNRLCLKITFSSFIFCIFFCHVFAGGLKTGPIFKRLADMRNKRTRWIHCYLQYFGHFQCSLHGPEDAQIFIAHLR